MDTEFLAKVKEEYGEDVATELVKRVEECERVGKKVTEIQLLGILERIVFSKRSFPIDLPFNSYPLDPNPNSGRLP